MERPLPPQQNGRAKALKPQFHQYRVSTLAPGCLHSEAAPSPMQALTAGCHADVPGAGIHPLEGRLPPGHQTAGGCATFRSRRHWALPMAPLAGPATLPHCIAFPTTTQHLTMPCDPFRKCSAVPSFDSPTLANPDKLCAAACAEPVGERIGSHTEALRLRQRKDSYTWRAQHQLHLLQVPCAGGVRGVVQIILPPLASAEQQLCSMS